MCAGVTAAAQPRPLPGGYRFELINVPGTISGLNDRGLIAGTVAGGRRGFVRDPEGSVRIFDLPGSTGAVLGLNNRGQIVGIATDASQRGQIFVREPTGEVNIRSLPAGASPRGAAINDSGHIATFAFDGVTLLPPEIDGPMQIFSVPATLPAAIPPTTPTRAVTGLNNRGDVAVTYTFQCPSFCFTSALLRHADGLIEPIVSTSIAGLNDLGQIAGVMFTLSFVRDFDGRFIRILVPGALASSVTAINNSGWIAASFSGFSREFLGNFIGSPCPVTVAVTEPSHGPGEETGVIDVSTDEDCAWAAASDSDFVIPTAGGQRGRGSVSYRVSPNLLTSLPRIASLSIGGKIVTITQAGAPCTYTVNPSSLTFSSYSGSAGVGVFSPFGCTWTGYSDAPWITGERVSNAYLVRVYQNPGPTPRSGTLTIAGHTIKVSQAAGASCLYYVDPFPGLSYPPEGGTTPVTVRTGETCAWTATSGADWIAIAAGGGATGPGEVWFRAAPNSGVTGRSGSVTVAGAPIDISQPLSLLMSIPTLVGPIAGSGAGDRFQFRIIDSRGADNILRAQILFNRLQRGDNACLVYFDAGTNLVQLRNDEGTDWSTRAQLGLPGKLENSQCAMDTGESYAQVEDNALLLNLALRFKSTFSEGRNVFAEALNRDHISSGYQNVGSYFVEPVIALDLSPEIGGAGPGGLFRISVIESVGFANVVRVQTLFGESTGPAGACLVSYERGDVIRLMNDSGTEFLGPIPVGVEGSLANNQCIVDAGRTRSFHRDKSYDVALAITFRPAFAGRKMVFAEALDASGVTTGFQPVGAWTAGGGEPPALAVIPDPSDPRQVTLQFQFQPETGWKDAPEITVGMSSCSVAYRQVERSIGVSSGSTVGPLPLGSPGTVTSGDCTIDLGRTLASVERDTLTLSLKMRFTGSSLRTISVTFPPHSFTFGYYGN